MYTRALYLPISYSSLQKKSQYLSDLEALGRASSILSQLPQIVKDIGSFVGFPLIKQLIEHRMRLAKYAEDSLSRHRKIFEEEGEDSKPTLLSKLYNGDMTFVEIRDSAASYIVAGSDTTVGF